EGRIEVGASGARIAGQGTEERCCKAAGQEADCHAPEGNGYMFQQLATCRQIGQLTIDGSRCRKHISRKDTETRKPLPGQQEDQREKKGPQRGKSRRSEAEGAAPAWRRPSC